MTAECRYCGSPVLWAEPLGRPMAFDTDPKPYVPGGRDGLALRGRPPKSAVLASTQHVPPREVLPLHWCLAYCESQSGVAVLGDLLDDLVGIAATPTRRQRRVAS